MSKKGVISLIRNSKMKQAVIFQNWIDELLDRIDNGESIGYGEKEEITVEYNIKPIDKYTEWCMTHDSIDVSEENIFYMGVIGKITDIDKNIDTKY